METSSTKCRFDSWSYDDSYMMKFKKIPVQVLAIQVGQEFEVKTLEGIMKGKQDDYLVKGIKGELYPVDKDIFRLTYEQVVK